MTYQVIKQWATWDGIRKDVVSSYETEREARIAASLYEADDKKLHSEYTWHVYRVVAA